MGGRRSGELWEVGDPASLALQALAENGNTVPLQGWLDGHKKVWTTWKAAAPLVPTMDPGKTGFSDTVTFTITAAKGAKYLSVASMLICTNDGFTGVNGLRLPKKIGDSKTVMPNAYDAGTEINTEDFADIVPPCQSLIGVMGEAGTNVTDGALAEGAVITHHTGVAGGGDLMPIHDWTDPVASITVERTG